MMDKVEVKIPDKESGDWKIESFEVTEEDARLHNIRCSFAFGMRGRDITPGTYKKLTHKGHLVMSNTPAEVSDHEEFLWEAKGRVLVNGLGLGVVINMLLTKEEVTSITVIEKSKDVIALVGLAFENEPRVEIIHADAFEWKPPRGIRYKAVWHDIWNDICADNLEEMKRLHRKYGRRAEWQGSWCRELCE